MHEKTYKYYIFDVKTLYKHSISCIHQRCKPLDRFTGEVICYIFERRLGLVGALLHRGRTCAEPLVDAADEALERRNEEHT